MSDTKIMHRTDTDSTKSTQTVPATKPSQPGGRLPPATPVSHWKRWKFRSSIFLMVLGATAIIVYLVLAGLAKQYAGLGVALCVIAVFSFLVWHAMQVFLEEDVIEEQTINKDHSGTNPTAPPPESGRDLK